MGSEEGQHIVRAWSQGGVLLESYRYAPGHAAETPRHSHGDYQLCFSPNFPGEYRYRGESHAVPVGSLSVIHPGEIHSAHDPQDREIPAKYRMLYAKPSIFQRVVADIAGHKRGLPSFPVPVVLDEHLARSFVGMHTALEGSASALEKDSRLLSVLSVFVVRWASERLSPHRIGNEPRAVALAREYLEDDPAGNVFLEELSRIAHLSSYHLCRVFKKEVGVPPHAYQINVRLDRAKDLLLGAVRSPRSPIEPASTIRATSPTPSNASSASRQETTPRTARSSKTKDPCRSILWAVSAREEGACRARRREKIPAKGARSE